MAQFHENDIRAGRPLTDQVRLRNRITQLHEEYPEDHSPLPPLMFTMTAPKPLLRFVAFALLGFLNIAPAWAEKPNIVLIFADDLGWQEPAYAGSEFCETPEGVTSLAQV